MLPEHDMHPFWPGTHPLPGVGACVGLGVGLGVGGPGATHAPSTHCCVAVHITHVLSLPEPPAHVPVAHSAQPVCGVPVVPVDAPLAHPNGVATHAHAVSVHAHPSIGEHGAIEPHPAAACALAVEATKKRMERARTRFISWDVGSHRV